MTVTETTSGCTATASQTINVFGLTTITPASDAICNGEGTMLMASSGSTYAWSSGETTQSINIFPTTTTTYTVTVTGATGCTGTASATVTVNPLPTATITPDLDTICVGQSTVLMAGGGTSYNWTTGDTTASITVAPTFFSSYGVTVTDANGCTAFAGALVVTNDPPAAPTISGSTSFCLGSAATLDAGAGYDGYMWSNGLMTQTVVISAPGIYTVTITDSNGCTASASTAVSLLLPPTATASSNGPICEGQTAMIMASGGTSYAWLSPAGSSTLQTITLENTSINKAGIYTVTVTGANGCTATAATLLEIKETPDISISGDTQLCTGETTTLDAGAGYTGGYMWSNGDTTNLTTVSMAGTYTVTVTSGNGCSATDDVNVSVNAIPTATASNNGPVCAGSSLSLTASGGNNYQWTGRADKRPTTKTRPLPALDKTKVVFIPWW